MSSSRSQDPTNVFVKFLPPEYDDIKLKKLFDSYGIVISCKVMVDQSNKSLGYGFVRFASQEETQNAIHHVNGKSINGKTLLCKLSNLVSSNRKNIEETQLKPSNNLYLRQIPLTVSDSQLKELFEPYGRVVECKIMVDIATGISRQIGFVRFETEKEATNALHNMDSKLLSPDSLPLIVRYAETPDQKQARKLRSSARAAGFLESTGMPFPPILFTPPTAAGFIPAVQYPNANPNSPNHSLVRNPNIPNQYPVPIEALPYEQLDPYWQFAYQRYLHPSAPGFKTGGYPMPAVPGPMQPYPMSYPPINSKDASPDLFIVHLPPEIDDSALTSMFAPFGKIVDCNVAVDRTSGVRKGFGFVSYDNVESAIYAMQTLNGSTLGDKYLKITFRQQKQDDSSNSPNESPNSSETSKSSEVGPS